MGNYTFPGSQRCWVFLAEGAVSIASDAHKLDQAFVCLGIILHRLQSRSVSIAADAHKLDRASACLDISPPRLLSMFASKAANAHKLD